MTTYIRYTALPILLTTLAACSGDDITTPEPQPVPTEMAISIGHASEMPPQHATRATMGLEEKGIKDFRLWGYKTMAVTTTAPYIYSDPQTVMDRYVVKWQANTAGTTLSNTADWEYAGLENSNLSNGTQTIKYWDFSASSYRFFAFAPSDALESEVNYTYPATHGDTYTWFDITFPADATNPDAAPYISKLWFGDNSANTHMYGDVVSLEFMKPVCKVRIQLLDMNGNAINNPSTEQGITSLTFAPSGGDARIVQAGRLKVSYAITGPTTITYYTPMVTIEGDPTGTVQIDRNDNTYNKWYQVLPHVEQNSYILSAQVAGKTKTAVVPAQYMSWNPNTEYTYIFKLTDQEFEFIDIIQIGVTEWIVEESDHDFYNW